MTARDKAKKSMRYPSPPRASMCFPSTFTLVVVSFLRAPFSCRAWGFSGTHKMDGVNDRMFRPT